LPHRSYHIFECTCTVSYCELSYGIAAAVTLPLQQYRYMSTSLQYPNVNFTVALHSMHRSKCITAILCLGVSVLMMHMMTSSSSTTSNHHSNNHPVLVEELCRSNRHIAGKWHKYDNKKTQQSKAFYCCGILDNDYLWNKTLCGDLQALNLEQLYLGTLRYDSGRGRIA
jgi:hypothetical protein